MIKIRKSKPIIIIFWLVVWEILSRAVDNNIILVGPAETAAALSTLLREADFWISVMNTFMKIGAGFVGASLIGIISGFISYKSRLVKEFLDPPIALMKSIPVASFVILAIIWLNGSENLSAFVAFVVVFPMVWQSTISGLSSTDKELLEMSDIFEIRPVKKMIYIYLPALLPYLVSCFKSSLSMSFKSGVAAELIGQPLHTVGGNLYQAKIFLDTPSLFAWTFVIILASSLFEKAALYLLERAAKRLKA